MTQDVALLIQQILNREENALVRLYDSFGGLVFSIAVRIIHDETAAEEITQDVFMKVWDKAIQFDPSQASFATWISRIARNTAIDALRKRKSRQPEHGIFSIEENPIAFEQTLAAQYSDDPTQTIAIYNALGDLPQEQAQLIYYAYFGGMTHNDIAEHTGVPLGTVKSRIRSGMQKLREVWMANPISP